MVTVLEPEPVKLSDELAVPVLLTVRLSNWKLPEPLSLRVLPSRWRTVQISVHPAFAPGYYTMILDGLRTLGFSIRVTRDGFPTSDFPHFYGHGALAFLLRVRGKERRIVVAAEDFVNFRSGQGEWANLIAKVNVHPSAGASYLNAQVLPVGPLFAVRTGTVIDAATTLARKSLLMRQELGDQLDLPGEYRSYFRRLPETSYRGGPSRRGYVFFAATSRGPDVSRPRAEFIRACRRQPAVRFEGGFAPRTGIPRAFRGRRRQPAPRQFPRRPASPSLSHPSFTPRCRS